MMTMKVCIIVANRCYVEESHSSGLRKDSPRGPHFVLDAIIYSETNSVFPYLQNIRIYENTSTKFTFTSTNNGVLNTKERF
jgi:hypothetical protein